MVSFCTSQEKDSIFEKGKYVCIIPLARTCTRSSSNETLPSRKQKKNLKNNFVFSLQALASTCTCKGIRIIRSKLSKQKDNRPDGNSSMHQEFMMNTSSPFPASGITLTTLHSASEDPVFTKLEMTLSSVDQFDRGNSPAPGTSVTSHSSPGSNSYSYQGMPESQSMNSFYGQVSSCPSNSSLEAAANFDTTNYEGNPRLLMPLSNCATTSASTIFRPDLNEIKVSSFKDVAKATVARRRSCSVKTRKNGDKSGDDALTHRRQKRLQRNRESARLSRRRRKVYLDVLEERVDTLSDELDKSRREHVAKAITSICEKRLEILSQTGNMSSVDVNSILDTVLSRTSDEMMVCNTFLTEQSKSFFLPPSIKCIMWLTLQSDSYFRGGRAASERLSAARIGERMLSSGTERATPIQQMWPLFCNEIGLSYEQEEKVRAFQKNVLQDHESWIDRHRVFGSEKLLENVHDSIQAITLRCGQQERYSASILSPDQRSRLLQWSVSNRQRIKNLTTQKELAKHDISYKISHDQHVAANLYVLNYRVASIFNEVSRAAPIVVGPMRKKLAIRPSFESLGAQEEKYQEDELAREDSFASSGSLQHQDTDMNIDGDEKAPTQISPQEAQEAAQPRIEEALVAVKAIIPPSPLLQMTYKEVDSFNGTTIVSSSSYGVMSMAQYQPSSMNTTSEMQFSSEIIPAAVSSSSIDQSFPAIFVDSEPQHERKSSFLPAHLNVVPEEMWPEGADDFLMDLVDGDWAIGEGIDMDQIT